MSVAHFELAGAVLLNASSYTIYKAIVGAEPRIWWPLFLAGLLLGAANAYLFTQSLRAIPLSIAFPVFSGVSFLAITLISALFFGEPVRIATLLGMALVLGGSFLIIGSA